MYEEDYIKRLIDSIGKMTIAITMGGDHVKNNIKLDKHNATLSEDGLLEIMIRKYIKEGKLNEAQDRIAEAIKSKSKKSYEVALSFYNEINNWDEEKLTKCNFSKEKIIKGVEHIQASMEQ